MKIVGGGNGTGSELEGGTLSEPVRETKRRIEALSRDNPTD
jgi:hypothetical protein